MIHTELKEKLKEAMKAKDAIRVSVIRDLLAAFTNELVATGEPPSGELGDEAAQTVIKRKIKQRKESIESFTQAGRDDLTSKEEAELAILKEFQPEQASETDIRTAVEQKKQELGVQDASQVGVLVGAVMKELKGQADGARVKQIVEEVLGA